MVKRLLIRSSRRFFARHPWQLGLTLLSIALGAAVIIAVDLANDTAERSFRQSVTTLVGPMTHEISARQGELVEEFYRDLRIAGYRASVPQVEGRIAIEGQYFTLLGIDPFAYLDLPIEQAQLPVPDLSLETLSALVTQPGSAIISRQLAERLGIEQGQSLTIRIGEARSSLTIIAIVPVDDAARRDVILTDIATAQPRLDKLGHLTRIQLMLDAAQERGLRSEIPEDLQLRSYASREQGFSQMTEAFRINLTAMSLLAMLVGAFLVYNTMTFSVLQRRQGFAIQRMLGSTGRQLFAHMLIEAFVLGIVGSALGVVLGMLIGQGLLGLITRTISDLYVPLQTRLLDVSPWLVFKGVAITMAAVLAATLGPAIEAARVQPVLIHRRSHLETNQQRFTGVLLVAGLGGFVISGLLLNIGSRNLVLGFTGLFVFIMAYSLMIPAVLKWLLAGVQHIGWLRSLNPRMVIRGVQASLSRTTLAIIALSVAVSATVGVSIMISSFRASVADWLDETLQSDIYISARVEEGAAQEGVLDPQWLQRLQASPGIASVSTGYDAQLEFHDIPVPTLVLQPGKQSARGFEFLSGNAQQIWQTFLNAQSILISEPFAYHHRLQRGDRLRVPTRRAGTVELEVAGVYRDYSASQGMTVLRRDLYERYWGDPGFSSIGLMLTPEANAAMLRQRLQAWAAQSGQPVLIRYNQEIKTYSLKVFDRTFAVTNVLRLLVIIVAFVGVFSALMALFLEKHREFAILRATGFTPGRLRLIVLSEAALIGLLAGLLSLPLGVIMSDILIEVINRRSFGWSMERYFFASIPLQAIGLAVIAAVLAALYPTSRISRSSVREGLHSE